MAPNKNNGTSIARNNHNGGSGTRQVLKKGPWTAMEDAILTEYVKKHGEGNWNAVQRNSGLMRCGKSCRLRWANHLRPHLKKGAFSLEEEWLIVELHAKLGNKWARMAAQGSLGVTGKVVANPCDQKVMGLSRKNSLLQKCELPGRTDNEIKNYWNTRLKRRQRAGLPIYPQDIQPQNYQQENQQQHSTNIPSPFDNHKNSNYNNNSPLSLLDIFNPSTMKPNTNIISHPYQFNNNPSPFLTTTNNINNQVKFFRDPRISLSLTLTSSMKNSQHSSMVRPVPNNFSQGYSSSMPASSQLQHSYPNFSTTTRPFSGVSSNPNGLILGMGTEHRSVRMSVPETTTSSDADNYAVDHGLSPGNSGLLEDLLEESQTLTRAEKIEENCSIEKEDNKGKLVWEEYGLTEEAADAILTEESTYNFAHGDDDDDATQNNHSEESSPLNSSSGITTKEASLEPGNQVDDDIMRFLDNFPLGVPVPDWCDDDQNHHDQQNTSNAQSFECDQIQLSKLI